MNFCYQAISRSRTISLLITTIWIWYPSNTCGQDLQLIADTPGLRWCKTLPTLWDPVIDLSQCNRLLPLGHGDACNIQCTGK
jgi:hypothetical protein